MGATNPGFSNKFEMREEVVDLHLEKTTMGNKIAPQDALFHQLDEFEKDGKTFVKIPQVLYQYLFGGF